MRISEEKGNSEKKIYAHRSLTFDIFDLDLYLLFGATFLSHKYTLGKTCHKVRKTWHSPDFFLYMDVIVKKFVENEKEDAITFSIIFIWKIFIEAEKGSSTYRAKPRLRSLFFFSFLTFSDHPNVDHMTRSKLREVHMHQARTCVFSRILMKRRLPKSKHVSKLTQ